VQEHRFREEPLHDIIGKPNSVHPELVDLCGHVDREARMVCIMDAEQHQKNRKFYGDEPT